MTPIFLRCAIALIAAAAIGLLSAPAGALGSERECPVPESFYTFEPPLTKTAKKLAGGREVVIAALGGSSTLGHAAGGAGLAWPARLASALAGRFPSARTKVVNLAVARQTAKGAADRLNRDVFPLKPALVIWETGTMEAVRGIEVDEFRETVQAGIDQVRVAGAEVVLMDMQFSRETHAVIPFEPYLIAMRELADANDVPLFRRHGIMRHWAESGIVDLRARDGEKRRQLAAKLYDCIGRALADFLTHGIPAAEPASSPGSGR
ncbi:MAG TPA: GDSL-type esterase/lipase family protein [Candidatus Binatia bacterium]|nr:GDSL-type esterase/lipase family protein [Candidatus Binatia bacterium]